MYEIPKEERKEEFAGFLALMQSLGWLPANSFTLPSPGTNCKKFAK